MSDFKQHCIELRKQDYSLLEIAKITGRPKTSVYFHIRHIPLSKKRVQIYRKACAARMKKCSEQRKGKSLRTFQKFDTWTTEMVLLVAHLMFDGEIKHFGCAYHNRSDVLVSRVRKLMQGVYAFEPKQSRNKATGVMCISYFNVALGAYFKEKSIELLETMPHLPRSMQKEFLRAFFDDEGCMYFREKTRCIRGYQKDTIILVLVQQLLSNFEITAQIKKPNEVVISGKENLRRFQEKIDFSPGVCINGKRTNSIWKESLEKREILERAINSFQT